MKRIILLLVVAVFALSASVVSAQVYIGGNIGIHSVTDSDGTITSGGAIIESGEIKWDNGIGFAGVIGINLDMFRIEGEVGYRSAEEDAEVLPTDLSLITFMANGYYDIQVKDSPVTPFVGVGLGMARSKVEVDTIIDESDTVFAYSFGAGASFAASETVSIDVGYKYIGTADQEYETTVGGVNIKFEGEYSSHNFFAGIRFAL